MELQWAGGVVEVVVYLPRKLRVLSSNPSATRKKKEKETFQVHKFHIIFNMS
jgi:hypothetical protein